MATKKRGPAQLYGVIAPPRKGKTAARFGLTTNRAEALRSARKEKGEVRSVNLKGTSSAWDAPTFKASSKLVKSFRS